MLSSIYINPIARWSS